MVGNELNTVYSCKCLNVQLRSSVPPLTRAQSDLPPASEWTAVFVGRDEDIKIIYPHLSLRSRHRGPYIPDPTRCARYTSLTCLCCKTLVYRIHQTVLLNDEVNIREGPVITKGWAETEPLRSSSGWLEVSTTDVLVGADSVSRQRGMPEFSELFGIVVPNFSTSGPTSPPLTPDLESSSQTQAQTVPKYHLPPIPAIFPESKSARSIFAVLAGIATRHSNAIRFEAEEYIDEIVKKKITEIERVETQLKRSVQIMLTTYSEGIKKAEQEWYALQGGSLPKSGSAAANENVPSPPASPSSLTFAGTPASVIRDFVPMRMTPSSVTSTTIVSNSSRHTRPTSVSLSSSLPRVSALSASLANSSFHHPRASTDVSDVASMTSSRLRTSDTDSLQSASSTTLTAPQELNHVYQLRRNLDDDVNTAMSYRFFQLEAEMERRKAETKKGKKPVSPERRQEADPDPVLQRATSSSTSPVTPNGKGKGKEVVVQELQNSPSTSRAKGKRKVTFDVQINSEPRSARNDEAALDDREMVFDFEMETNERDVTAASNETILPLVESATQQQASSSRPRPVKRISNGGSTVVGSLPASFSALRPASLPLPSPVPLTIKPAINLTSATNSRAESSSSTPVTDSNPPSPVSALDRERNAKILNILGASLPSHRAAWAGKNDDTIYQTFIRGTAEDEDDDYYETDDTQASLMQRELSLAGIPSSVPISIQRRTKPKAPPLSLASYQPAAVLVDNMPSSSQRASGRLSSGTKLRRAAYTERDVQRGIDPGVLDFVMEEQPEDEDEDELGEERFAENGTNGRGGAVNGVEANGVNRGRDRAHKILESQAKSGVPDDGMWRSLI